MLIRGQLVLNINLKDPLEIKKAILLLECISSEHALTKFKAEMNTAGKAASKDIPELSKNVWVGGNPIMTNEKLAEALKAFPHAIGKKNRHVIAEKKLKKKQKLLTEHIKRSEAAKKSLQNRKRDKKTGHFLPVGSKK